MAKQKKTSGPISEAPELVRDVGRAPVVDPSMVDQASLGNAALQAQLGGARAPETASLGAVRDLAVNVIDHVGLALQLDVVHPETLARFQEILDRSLLPDDRKERLSFQLLTAQAGALTVHDALVQHFGEDTEELRGALVDALDIAQDGLASGGAAEAGWQVGERAIPLSETALGGPMIERAGALLGEVTAALAAAEVGGRAPSGHASTAVSSFSLAVFRSLTLDEEEEEEWDDSAVGLDG